MIRVINENISQAKAGIRDRDMTLIEPVYTTGQQTELINVPEFGRYVRLAFPLIWSDGQVVTLEVIDQIDHIDDTMDVLSYVLIAALLLMVVPIWLAGKGISSIVIQPINKLNQVMKKNQTEGEWELIELNSNLNRSEERRVGKE